jgi:DUF177 domain-containing protein
MDPQFAGQVDLDNDTMVNVAALLREQTGANRSYRFQIDRFPLDDDLYAVGLSGILRLTRVSDAILASVTGTSSVVLECQRCLEEFSLPVSITFEEQFRIAYDVRRGIVIESETEGIDERPEISENHELDFSEPMRQEIIVALPMRPVCGPDCPGPPIFADGDEEDGGGQFSALATLLGQSDEE